MNWSTFAIAPDSTHHLVDGRPPYFERFDEVLKFHPPGLAAVLQGGQAWHIGPDGRAAYERRFLRAFGFYEDCAAIVDPGGWHHILPNGEDAYSDRYAWCGNFQGGRCPVRMADGHYQHIDARGLPAYQERWRYTGDYRDGIAVVQGEDGRSTHIDSVGRMVHGRWFLDLDVFHKGFARARDEDGWMHVTGAGAPAYARRFAAVEPFYNGQARVERMDGAFEVIDERGISLVDLRAPLRTEFASLSEDLVGFWRTQAIAAAVALGVIDALPATSEEIARGCCLDPDRAHRLLRALGELQLVASTGPTWVPTPRGEHLRRGHPQSLAGAAIEYADHFQPMWSALPGALRKGATWTAPAIFDQVAQSPERVVRHHEMLRNYARHDYAKVPEAMGLRGDEVVIDAAGGLGVLAELLLSRYPNLHLRLLERPEVAGIASVSPEHTARFKVQDCDILSPWGVQGDAVVLSRVLHDWEDHDALRILRHARASLPTGGRLFIVEMVLPDPGMGGALCDLHLLVATGGRERTLADYERLMAAAGFDLQGVTPLPAVPSLLRGVAR